MAEQEPKLGLQQEKTRSAEELLSLVQEKGSPDLSEISQTERGVLLNWYKRNELSEKNQVDFLEKFMRYGLVDDTTILEFIKPMNENQKTQLGEYLGRTIKSGKYLQSF